MSEQAPAKPDTLAITVDGREMDARPGEMLIAAAERGGVYIPRFCWHPRMKPVGMCRMCLVEIEGPRGFALQPACYVPVRPEMNVVTTSDKVKKAQDGVLEFLLINHPLDCPVCDRGGECPLQDQTFAFGPGESRFIEEKRHWAKPIPINPLVALDRERCIQCARCTRFADQVADDALIDFVGRSDVTEVNTFPDEPFVSNFSGNIVQICPVGALTATPYRFRARPWDLDVVESTCTLCAVGCRMAVQSSANRLIRNLGIDSDPVNWGWLCDKGRFGYEANHDDERLTRPLVRKNDELVEASWGEALGMAAAGLRKVLDTQGPDAVAVLGGARLPNEDAYAWAKLAKGVLRTDHVDCQMGDGLPPEVVLGLPRATIDEACSATAVVVLAPDIKEELPVLYLRLHDAATRDPDPSKNLPIIEIGPVGTGLSGDAAVSLLHRPGEGAAVARAVVAAVGGGPVPDGGVSGVPAAGIRRAAELLGGRNESEAADIVVVLGRPSVAEAAHGVVEAAQALAGGLPAVRFLSALRRGNVHGALDAGLAPGLLPGRVTLEAGSAWYAAAWGAVPEQRGLDAHGVLATAVANRIQALVLVGSDPLADFPDRALARRGLAGTSFTVVVDTFLTGSALHADVVLPAVTWGERPGTTTNLEGRVTRLSQKVTPPGTTRPDWMIAAQLARALGDDLGFDSIDAIAGEMERLSPAHAGLTPGLLARPGYRDGLLIPLAEYGTQPARGAEVPTEAVEVEAAIAQGETLLPRPEPAGAETTLDPVATDEGTPASSTPAPAGPRPPLLRFEGVAAAPAPHAADAYSLRLVATRSMYDAGAVVQHCPSLAPLSRPTRVRANPHDLSRLGVVTGDLVRVTSQRAGLVVEAVSDPLVPRGSAAVDFNQPGEGAGDLIDAAQPVIDVRLETVSRDRHTGGQDDVEMG